MLRCFIPFIPIFLGCRTRGEPPPDPHLERSTSANLIGLLAEDDALLTAPTPRGDAGLPLTPGGDDGPAEGGSDTAAVDPADTGDAPETETGQAIEADTGADTAEETGEAPADTAEETG